MTDYEKWMMRVINDAALEEKSNEIYKQCEIDEVMAHINQQNVSDVRIKNAHRKAQADVEREFYK
jgi:hypothetical protein